MKKTITPSHLLTSLALLVAFTGCTKKEAAPESSAASNKLEIAAVGESMMFDKKELTVKAGDKVTLTMKNPSSTLQHNWLLVQPGKEDEVGIAGIKAGEAKGYIPDSPAIIAHTGLVKSKGEETITFTAPPAGDYPYICSFPGHHTVMRGVLHSK